MLIDPDRALRVLGIEAGRSFSPKVQYVYRKQLEEAEVLVINKIDAVDPARVSTLREVLQRDHPAARVVELSARKGDGLVAWIDSLLAREGAGHVLDIDYDDYADGEALLGWLNCTASVDGRGADGDELLAGVAARVHHSLPRTRREIAHLKLTLTPLEAAGYAVVNAVRPSGSEMRSARRAGRPRRNHRQLPPKWPARLERAVRRRWTRKAGPARDAPITHLELFRPHGRWLEHLFARRGYSLTQRTSGSE